MAATAARGDAGLALALAGGGTGGHIVPGLHLLRHLQHRRQAAGDGASSLSDLCWFVAGRPIEERALAGLSALCGEAEVELCSLPLEPPAGGAPSLPRLLARTLPATRQARRALLRHRSDVLLGLGGFTSLPAVLAARSLGIPVILLEINATSGKATRWLGPLARRVVHAWPGSLPGHDSGRHVLLGPPLAPEFLSGAPTPEETAGARRALGFAPEVPLLLILGGSQGAASLNRFAHDWAPRLCAGGLALLHQVGPGRLAEGAAPLDAYRPVEYLDDVPQALQAATLVLCRGGASTLAEVAARARPAVVVPYPHHADRHQEKNARGLGEGVRIVAEEALDGKLVQELLELAGPAGAERRAAMSAALLLAVPRDAGARLLDEVLELAGTASDSAAGH